VICGAIDWFAATNVSNFWHLSSSAVCRQTHKFCRRKERCISFRKKKSATVIRFVVVIICDVNVSLPVHKRRYVVYSTGRRRADTRPPIAVMWDLPPWNNDDPAHSASRLYAPARTQLFSSARNYMRSVVVEIYWAFAFYADRSRRHPGRRRLANQWHSVISNRRFPSPAISITELWLIIGGQNLCRWTLASLVSSRCHVVQSIDPSIILFAQ